MKKIKINDLKKNQIKALAGYGMTDADIANVVGLAEATMQRKCKDELKIGRALAKSNVTQTAYKMAVSGKQPAITMFWLKTQCRWREIVINEFSGKDGKPIELQSNPRADLSVLTAEELTLFKSITEKLSNSNREKDK